MQQASKSKFKRSWADTHNSSLASAQAENKERLMANRVRPPSSRRHLDDTWNSESALAQALAEKAEFLDQHPEYREYQKEIDRLLDKAGTMENRMAVLAMLMEGKLLELHQQLQKLNGILIKAGVKPGPNYLIGSDAVRYPLSRN
jgi:hypothetical protein